MVTTYDKDGAYIAVTEDAITHRRSIRWEDCVVSFLSGTKLKVDLIYVNASNNLVLVLEDESEIEVIDGADMTKAVYDPDADGVIAKAQLDVALANTSGTNTGDQTLSGLGGIAHSLATAINDFLVASGAGAFVKKTLAEVKTLLDWAADQMEWDN